ncbi:helix-hairpin-helix domain-containing protein [Mariniphaga sp.]|uniref:helix-hairpin-helix domain-containing protein n=1 Tax=Mariniphaga sp. TaxID=1954475 RepID=UPI003565D83C
MKNTFRQIFKGYFNFSKQDRSAVVALSVIIFLFLAGNIIVGKIELNPSSDFSAIIKAFEEWEKQTESENESRTLFHFNPNTITEEALDSFNMPAFIKRNMLSYRSAGGKFNKTEDVRRIYGMNDSIFSLIESYIRIPAAAIANNSEDEPGLKVAAKPTFQVFDPNTANKDELLNTGFNQFQASNLIKYRESGGSFSQPEDLLIIYGIDSVFYNSIKSFINVAELPEEVKVDKTVSIPIRIELNSADSLDLLQLNGIGPVYASRILKYRSLLGGFYGKHQLLEVYGFPEETYHAINENLTIDSLRVEKLRINFAGYAELIRHPYFEKRNVEAILNFRQNNGPFSSHEQLLTEGLIDTASFALIRPYITCR